MPQITERGLVQMIHYVCKYTPVELLNAFGEECAVLEEMPENFEMSDQIAHANLCGFGKSVIQAVLELDFMPDFGDVEFLQMLKERKIRLDGLVMEQYFNGLFHKKLAGALLKRIGISGTMPVHDLSEENLERLCRICKHFRTYIDKTNPFEQAQICAGGVDTSEIDPDTMESKLVKGLYFAGEILDVDGICGGYNLQWAWTSGYLAGKGAANA